MRTNTEIDDDDRAMAMQRYRLAGRPMTREEALAMRGARALDDLSSEVPPRS